MFDVADWSANLVKICHTTDARMSHYGFYFLLDQNVVHLDPAIKNGAHPVGQTGDSHARYPHDCKLITVP